MFTKQSISSTKYLLSAFFIFSLASCTFYFSKSAYMDDQEDKNSILIFGYLDDSEAPFTMKEGDIKQVRPASDEPYKDLRSDNNGLFYLENLPTGLYKINSVTGPAKGLSSDYWVWSFPDANEKPEFKRLELKADKPGLYYVGSYKIKLAKKGGFFGVDKYETMAVNRPSEKQVLIQMLPYAEGTKWERVIKQRIRRLK